jgi:anaerobic magnesium-protoporphyrin IX monomethyl ester cyclase
MRVLMVVARQGRMTPYHLPAGIGYVSASLKRAGHEVAVLNPNHSTEDLEPLLERIIHDHDPQVIALGGMAFHLNQIRQILAVVRPLLPHAVIVVGGPLVSNQPEAALAAMPEADIGVIGEGEHTIVELVDALAAGKDLGQVRGLAFWGPSRITLTRTAPRLIEENLDALPWVDWEGLGLDIYAGLPGPGDIAPGLVVDMGTRVMPLLTSRGCPFPCTFCCHEAAGKRYRSRSLDDVFAELDATVDKFGINALFIYDDLFCLKRERLEEFCERIRPFNLRWECSLRVEQVKAEQLKLMKASGCVCISFGVESMSPTVLKSMKKKTTKEALDQALGLMYEAKVTTWANLIFGDPAETFETARESLEWWAANNQFDLRTAFIGYHPGSRIYDEAVQRGLITDATAFLLADKPEINGTALTDNEYGRLRTEVSIVGQSFGFPGQLLELTPIDADTYSMRTICPHCGKDQSYSHLRLSRWAINRISCRDCNQLYRLPIVFRAQPSSEFIRLYSELQKVLASSGKAITSANMGEINDLCTKMVSLDSGYEQIWILMAEVASLRGESELALSMLTCAIIANPFMSALFDDMSVRLTRLGREQEGFKYVRQAALLRRIGVCAPTYVAI